MRLILYAFLLAVLTLGSFVIGFLLFEQSVGPKFAFWPSFFMQWVLEKIGIFVSNRFVVWATFVFWWLIFWLGLNFFKNHNFNKKR